MTGKLGQRRPAQVIGLSDCDRHPVFLACAEGPYHQLTSANVAACKRPSGPVGPNGRRLAEVLPRIGDQGLVERPGDVPAIGEPVSGTCVPVPLKTGKGDDALRYDAFGYQPVRTQVATIKSILWKGLS